MNRHIYGFTLFVVIVKTTVLFYWAFFAPAPFVSEPAVFVSAERKTSCFPKSKYTSNKIYAELDLRKRVLHTTVRVPNNLNLRTDESAYVILNFFKKYPEQESLHITKTAVKPSLNHNGYLEFQVTSSHDWLDRYDFENNLYVAAKVVATVDEARHLRAVGLNASDAVPVLVSHKGK